jgi:CheY-like chemotaxis protein
MGKSAATQILGQSQLAGNSVLPGKPARSRVRVDTSSSGNSVASTLPGRRTLLWIDDYEPVLTVYKATFERFGFRVLTAAKASLGLKMVAAHQIDAVVTDFEMPGMDGGALVASIKSSYPQLPVILFSGSCLIPDQVRRLADAFCHKTSPRTHLLATIEEALTKRKH